MTQPTVKQVLDRRRAQRAALLAKAERFADGLASELVVRAVVVFGSVARGDFHDASDVDVLVVADELPSSALRRNAAVGIPPAGVEFVAWTTTEWRQERARDNPIAAGALEHGVVVRGALPG